MRRYAGSVPPYKIAKAPGNQIDERAAARAAEQQKHHKEPEPMTVIPMKQPEQPAEPPKTQETRKPLTSAHGTRWTKEQDKALIEAYDANLTMKEIVQFMQDVRPGTTEPAAQQRATELRTRLRSLTRRAPTKPVTVKAGVATAAELAMLESRGEVRVEWQPEPQEKRRAVLARVTFEIGGKVRVVEVDEATAREMLAKAMTL